MVLVPLGHIGLTSIGCSEMNGLTYRILNGGVVNVFRTYHKQFIVEYAAAGRLTDPLEYKIVELTADNIIHALSQLGYPAAIQYVRKRKIESVCED